MNCMMSNCKNEARKGWSTCTDCAKPYLSDYGTLINPPNIREDTYIEMCKFFAKAELKRINSK